LSFYANFADIIAENPDVAFIIYEAGAIWNICFISSCNAVGSFCITIYVTSGSWLAWANDTAVYYAAIRCGPCQWTTGFAVQHADTPLLPSGTLGLYPVWGW